MTWGQLYWKWRLESIGCWKDIANCSPTFKGYWAQWSTLVVIDGIVKQHWESADRWFERAQIVLTQSKVKKVMGEVHGESSGPLDVNRTLDKVRHWYYLLLGTVLRSGTYSATSAQQAESQSLMHQ
jgi:hypothetical protein